LIGAVTTRTGLHVQAERDTGIYPAKIKVSDEELAAVLLTPHAFHGEWNYTITPDLLHHHHKSKDYFVVGPNHAFGSLTMFRVLWHSGVLISWGKPDEAGATGTRAGVVEPCVRVSVSPPCWMPTSTRSNRLPVTTPTAYY